MARKRARKRTRTELPDDVWGFVLGKLPLWSQWQARGTCKEWSSMVASGRLEHEQEEFILVNCVHSIRWYNLAQQKWMRKMKVGSLKLPLTNPRLGCVFRDLFLFHDPVNSPTKICIWNAVTRKCEKHEIQRPLPAAKLQFGAYKEGDELKVLVFAHQGWDMPAKLFSFVPARRLWSECSSAVEFCAPNLNNLVSGGSVVPFLSDYWEHLHLYNVLANKFTSYSIVGHSEDDVFARYWCDFTEVSGRFHLAGDGGTYLVGPRKEGSDEEPPRPSVEEDIGVFRYNVGQRAWELAGRSPEGVMVGNGGTTMYFFCSDGVENIWSLMPGCDRMLQFNVMTSQWLTVTLGKALPFRRWYFREPDDDGVGDGVEDGVGDEDEVEDEEYENETEDDEESEDEEEDEDEALLRALYTKF